MDDCQGLIARLSDFKKKVKLNQEMMFDQEFQQLKSEVSEVISEQDMQEIEAAVSAMSEPLKLESSAFYPVFQKMYAADIRTMRDYFLHQFLDVRKSKDERNAVYKTWLAYSSEYCKLVVGVIGVLGTLMIKACNDVVTASRYARMNHREQEAIKTNPEKIKQHIKQVIAQNPLTQCCQTFFKVAKQMQAQKLNALQETDVSVLMHNRQ